MRVSIHLFALFILLFFAPVPSFSQLDSSSKEPPDAAELTQKMGEIIEFIGSRQYVSDVTWPEHIVLSYQLAKGIDPTLLEFTVINDNHTEIGMDRHTVLAIAITGDNEMPSWDQIRVFLGNRSATDFQLSPSIRNTAKALDSASRADILKAIEAAETRELSESGPFPAQKSRPVQKALPGTVYNTYFGFLHAHSNLSDGSGSPDEAYSYARDVAGLDFFALTDHGINMIVWPWESSKYHRLLRSADDHDAPGSYAALYGFEWSHPILGHINVMNVRSFTHVLRRLTLNSIYRWIGDRVYSIARYNHPGRQDMTNDEFKHFRYEAYPSNNMVGLEVWNKGHDFDEQFYRCDWGSCQAPTFMDEGIRKGWRLGPLGGGDNHHREWGTNTDFRVAVLSTQLTRNDIINAYFDRRFYATEDRNLLLDIRVGGNPMGSRLTGWHRNFRMEASDSGGDTFSEVRFYRDGYLLETQAVSGSSIEAIFSDPDSSGNNHYYVVVRQSDGDEAVSSPIYMNGAPPPTPPEACSTHSCNGFFCGFDATCSTGQGGIDSYAWNFGDGSAATGVSVNHNYASGGTYTVQLTVTDSIGQTDTSTEQVTVTPPVDPPVACATYSCDGFSCDFNASCSTGDGGITAYDWNFGDGNTALGVNVTHTYASGGTYNVLLAVTDILGQTDTDTQQVSVNCGDTTNPNVSLTAPTNNAFVWGSTTFSANASDNVGVDRVQFRINNQIECTANNPPWSCQINVDSYATGDYPIKAVAFDNCGNHRVSNTRTLNIVSNPAMEIDFPAAGTAVSGQAVEVSGWASDPDGVTSLTITLNCAVTIPVNYGTPRAGVCQAVPLNDPNCPNVGFEATFNSQLYENGPHSIVVVATDASGKESSKTINFTIDNAPIVDCTPGPNTLCLQDNRFKVEAFYVSNGSGQAARTKTYSDDSGFFWFFNPDNIEVGVKVLGPVNGYWWVFHGAGTDREYTIAATDTVTGEVRSYVKPSGSFCGDADTQAFPDVAGAQAATPAPANSGAEGGQLSGSKKTDTVSKGTTNQSMSGCTSSSTRMCLQEDRFQVEVLRNGVAQSAVELTDESGTVWFFNADNAEVFIKVLDGRALNDHYWVFYGSLTDRDYTIRVVDTVTDQEVTYDNALGGNCGNGDTNAFFEAP